MVNPSPQSQPSPQPSTLAAIIRLLRWDKPTGRLILMIPALWSVVLAADGQPPLPLVGVIMLGTLATSAAGCVVNDLWDRNIDPHVARTRTRPLAARDLSVQVGLGVLVVALVCAYGLSLYLNPLSFWLCVLAVPFILFYPLAKRVFPVPQLVLSLAWGFAVLIPWAAVTNGWRWCCGPWALIAFTPSPIAMTIAAWGSTLRLSSLVTIRPSLWDFALLVPGYCWLGWDCDWR